MIPCDVGAVGFPVKPTLKWHPPGNTEEKKRPSSPLLLTGAGLQHHAVIGALASCHSAVDFLQTPVWVPSQRNGDRAGTAAAVLIALVFN